MYYDYYAVPILTLYTPRYVTFYSPVNRFGLIFRIFYCVVDYWCIRFLTGDFFFFDYRLALVRFDLVTEGNYFIRVFDIIGVFLSIAMKDSEDLNVLSYRLRFYDGDYGFVCHVVLCAYYRYHILLFVRYELCYDVRLSYESGIWRIYCLYRTGGFCQELDNRRREDVG